MEKLKDLAHAQKTLTELINQALREYLQRQEQGQEQESQEPIPEGRKK